jgi:hypothetical protein
MQKLLLLLSLLALTFNFSSAQKIQLKKGIISRDGEPIGKMDGKASLLKGTSVSIQSLEGTDLMNITSPIKTFPLYESIMYYHIRFATPNKTISFIPEKFLYSEKNLVEFLFESIGTDFLTKEGLNADMVDKFIADKDQSQAIAHDTTYYSNLVKISKEKLKEPVVSRPLDSKVRLYSTEKKTIEAYGQKTLETFDIFQGNVLIGKLTKFYKGDPTLHVNATPPPKEVEYTVLRKISAFSLDEKTIEFVNMAKVKSSISTPDIYSHCDGTWAKDLQASDIYSAESAIVNWLISKGCL